MKETKTFPSSLDLLPEMTGFIKRYFSTTTLPKPLQDRLELGAEEALVNIISYAYEGGEGEITIETDTSSKNRVEIHIIDTGAHFDPTHYLKENPPILGTEKMTVGGYGVFLMIEIFDEVTYRRVNEKNILTLSHHLNAP